MSKNLWRILMFAIIQCVIYQLNYAQSVFSVENRIVQSDLVSIAELLQLLSEKEGLFLAYESGLLKDKYCLPYKQENSLQKNLNTILKNTGLEYKITENKQVLIRKTVVPEQTYQQLYGMIKDRKTKEPLAYSMVYLSGTHIGSYADSLGRFQLNIPNDYIAQSDTITISRVGYKNKQIALSDFIHNIDIDLDTRTKVFPTITIIASLELEKLIFDGRHTSISNQDYILRSFANDDILRKLQFLPSIAAHKDNSAKVRIRGSKSYETMILLDGLRIYNPTHFYNVFSSVNNSYVRDIVLYKNQIPPDTRSMTGGVVKMFSKSKVTSSFEGSLDLNLMDLSAMVTIPIHRKMDIIIAARKSIFERTRQSFFGNIISSNQYEVKNDKLLNINDQRKNQSFDYYDINAKVIYEISPTQKMDFVYYKSKDDYGNIFKKELKKPFTGVPAVSLKFDLTDISIWENQGMGLSYSRDWSSSFYSKIAFSRSTYQEQSKLDVIFSKKHGAENTKKRIYNTQKSTIGDWVLKWDNYSQWRPNHKLVFGLDATQYYVKSAISIENKSIFNQSQNATALTLYIGDEVKWNKWDFKYSLQSSYYTGTNNNYFDPNISAQYKPNNKWNFFIFLNQQHQYLRNLDYENRQGKNTSIWVLTDKRLPILAALNLSAGTRYSYNNSVISIEGFTKYKKGLSTLVVNRPGNLSVDNFDFRLFFGNGFTKGLELLWNQKIGLYNSQLAYTFSFNNQRFLQFFHGALFPSPDDTRHQIKWVQSYKYKKFNFGINTIYSSGLPYFDFSNLEKEAHRERIDFEKYIRYLPDYFRLDLSSSYHFNLWSKSAEFNLSIFNITNRINISNTQILRANSDNEINNQTLSNQTNLLSRTINLGLKIKI